MLKRSLVTSRVSMGDGTNGMVGGNGIERATRLKARLEFPSILSGGKFSCSPARFSGQ